MLTSGHLERADESLDPPALPLPPLPPGDVPYATAHAPGSPWTAPWGVLPYARVEPYRIPPRVWTVIVAFAVAFVAGIVVGGLVPLVMVIASNAGRFENAEELRDALQAGILKAPILLASGATTQVMLLITAVSAAMLSPVPFVRRMRLNPSTLSPLGWIIVPIGALSVSFLFSAIVGLIGIRESGTLKLLGDVFKKLTPAELVFAVAIVGIMPGFAEEFLFRGYAQTRLVQRLGRWWGILIVSLMFGIMHLDFLQSPFAFGFGIYLGYVAEQSGSIRPTMFCHALNNSLQVLLGWLIGSGSGGGGEEPGRLGFAIMALIAGTVVAACVVYLKFAVRPPATGPDEPPADSSFPPAFSAQPVAAS